MLIIKVISVYKHGKGTWESAFGSRLLALAFKGSRFQPSLDSRLGFRTVSGFLVGVERFREARFGI